MSKAEVNEENPEKLPKNMTYLPLRINDKQNLMGLDSDVIGILIAGIIVGNMTKELMYCLCIAVLIATIYTKLKESFPRGRFVHWLWWHGVFTWPSIRSFPDTFKRTYYR